MDVTVIDVLYYIIARFKLQVLGAEYAVSMMEGGPGELQVVFPRAIPLAIVLDTVDTPSRLRFVHDPEGVPANPATLEKVFEASLSTAEYGRLAAQLQPVARRILPDVVIAGADGAPQEADTGERRLFVASLPVNPALAAA
jgi:hypothetical protein